METAKHLESIQPSYIREILDAPTAKGVISLAGGLPAEDLFPYRLLSQAMTAVSTQAELFQYGQTAGYGPLLEYFRSAYQLSEQQGALVCNGSQQAIDLVARAFINPGDVVAMEAPSYLGAIQVFRIAQARIETVPQLVDGPDLESLETLFASGRIKLFYAVPDFHNPSGICWSLPVRQQVAKLCCHYGVGLIEDAPYRDLRFSGEHLPSVSSLCPEQSLMLRSFSKVSVPGIRLGVVTGQNGWLEPMIKIKQASDLHTNLPMQAVLLQLLTDSTFPTHINKVSAHYREKHRILDVELKSQLSTEYHFEPVAGGMFIWLQLPEVNAMAVAKAALAQGVAVVPSDVFYLQGQSMCSALRLNFSHAQVEQLPIAVERLAKALQYSY